MMNAEQAAEIKNSILWGEFFKEIEKNIDSVKSQMESCPVDQLRDLQRDVLAYRKVLTLPQAIIDRED